MTTATTLNTYGRTSDTPGYKTFTWQSVQKIADEMGVQFYNEKTQYRTNGMGIRATSANRGFGDTTKIIIENNVNNIPHIQHPFASREIYRHAYEAFKLKVELWALKNNVQYVLVEKDYDSYIQIVENN